MKPLHPDIAGLTLNLFGFLRGTADRRSVCLLTYLFLNRAIFHRVAGSPFAALNAITLRRPRLSSGSAGVARRKNRVRYIFNGATELAAPVGLLHHDVRQFCSLGASGEAVHRGAAFFAFARRLARRAA